MAKDERFSGVAAGRVSTGIEALDEVLDGGVPRGSIVFVTGLPGSGKTILSEQALFANAAVQSALFAMPGVLQSLFSNPSAQQALFANAAVQSALFNNASVQQALFAIPAIQQALFANSWQKDIERFRSNYVFRGAPRVTHGLER